MGSDLYYVSVNSYHEWTPQQAIRRVAVLKRKLPICVRAQVGNESSALLVFVLVMGHIHHHAPTIARISGSLSR